MDWRKLRVSGWLLIVANLVPLIGVLAFDWDVFKVMILFWAENVVIGVTQILRLAFAGTNHGSKLTLTPFFAVHYGMFTLGHGAIVMALFGGPAGVTEPTGDLAEIIASMAAMFAADRDLLLGLGALTVSHLYSFASNYLGRGLFRDSSPRVLFAQPYGRVIIMHVTALVGGFAAQQLGSPAWALLVLVSLKLLFDLRGHLQQNQVGSDPQLLGANR